ncbi:MAG: phosphoribosyltransferase family protein [Dehalococcoidia bacterium]|jgi:orotate phosphoribosyltransferase/uridine monophosphate synthetase|nr:phosphoribosyltransferase family protein [Dehalococcoidia bacterium]
MSGSSHTRPEPEGRLWLCEELWRLGGVQFGDFSLGRTVRHSPVYLNPKLLISRPGTLAHVARLIESELQTAMTMRKQQVAPFDVIAGVPIGGLHVATALSLQMRVPLLYARPDPTLDDHARPHIEGIYRPGQSALIVDDLTAGGGSLVQTAERLRGAGLYVSDAIVLVDREQGARRRLESMAINLHPVITMEVLLTSLHEGGRITAADYERSMNYLHREGDARSEFD